MARGARAHNAGLGGLCSQWVPGAKALVGGLGERSPPEADEILAIEMVSLHSFVY